MSRVHDALRRAEQACQYVANADVSGLVGHSYVETPTAPARPEFPHDAFLAPASTISEDGIDWANLLSKVQEIPLQIAPEAHLINLERPHEVPGEEFRSLRTRLNHVQGQQ